MADVSGCLWDVSDVKKVREINQGRDGCVRQRLDREQDIKVKKEKK